MGFFAASSWRGTLKLPTIPLCGKCGLFRGCQSPKMPPTGRGNRRILFVGEAPGRTEDECGEQFVGKAGDCLRDMLDSLGVDIDDCWKTNAAICRPPGNKIDWLYIDCCRPNLLNTIKSMAPNVIVLLGLSAVRSLIGFEWSKDVGAMGRWVGWTIPSPTYNAWLCPTYHPSYVLREREDAALVKITKQHLKRAVALELKLATPLDLDQLKRGIETIPSVSDARKRLRALARERGRLTFDYETTGLKPESSEQAIHTMAYCVNGGGVVSCRIDETCFDALRDVLRSPHLAKVAHNLKFEDRWTRAKLGTPVVNWFWCTMTAAHVLDNRPNINSLKFQAYVRYGVPDYDSDMDQYRRAKTANGLNRIREAPIYDLLIYGGLDVIFTDRLAMDQREEMRIP